MVDKVLVLTILIILKTKDLLHDVRMVGH
jgi:hypothetical protein